MNYTEGIYIGNVGYIYPNGVKALENITLFIPRGQTVAIMGKNGAGKSTLLKLINGLYYPTYGNVYIDGKNTRKFLPGELTATVGLVFQNPEKQLFLGSISEELDFSLSTLDISEEEKKKYKEEIIEKMGLRSFLEVPPTHLSGGQLKKAALASILCRKPRYILFDEPTQGQDRFQKDLLCGIIEEEKRKGNTIIIVTHDTEFAFEYTDRLLVFSDGKLVADGPTRRVIENENILEKASLGTPSFIEVLKYILSELPNTPDPISESILKCRNYRELMELIENKINNGGQT